MSPVGVAKLANRIFEIALERLDVQAGETVFIDDDPRNTAAAAALGLETILYETTPQTIASLNALLAQP